MRSLGQWKLNLVHAEIDDPLRVGVQQATLLEREYVNNSCNEELAFNLTRGV